MRNFVTALAIAATMPAITLAAVPSNGGPYNARFLAGGVGIERPLADADALVRAGAAYTLSAWVRPDLRQDGVVTLIALGDPAGTACRCLRLESGKLAFVDGAARITGGPVVAPNRWSHIAIVSDGERLTLYVDGRQVAHGAAGNTPVAPKIAIAPVIAGQSHFGGTLIEAQADAITWQTADVVAAVRKPPTFDLVHVWNVGVGWEWQNRANTGLWQPQDPWTLPKAKGPGTPPVAKPLVAAPALQPIESGRWQVNGWKLAAAADVTGAGAQISRPGYNSAKWHHATVPGTVLTTLVDRGVYPDPYYGLNNLKIPESLARQDWWYRTAFNLPADVADKRIRLRFNGINYASEIWLNGERLGNIKGAFIRGTFEIEPQPGENVIAVRVSPPPHPGIPHEQSITGGVGENGGQMAIDGPTFVATEGWDWIPAMRDRNTGIWQSVELEARGDLVLGDPQIITDLPLPRTDSADIHIRVPVTNHGNSAARASVTASFDGRSVTGSIDLAPGASGEVKFSPDRNPELRVANPKLWWPNGYGEAALHRMNFTVGEAGGTPSDTRSVRFGIREVSYDLSLFDSAGQLRRVNVQTTDGGLKGEKLIDVSHEAIKRSPRGWVESLTAAGEKSAAVTNIAEPLPEPHLTLRVNGVRIAARGGNWGMDDAMKRVSRARLEPYFRLQRDANMNVIRNWMGNNNQPEFFDLADEYGMMVLNDFWQSTQNFQVEPQDPQLFLTNARDTVARYRNHPSIVLWFGRNEGVPHPILNEGLDDVVHELDGTRWFSGSSNVVNLQGSGPYNYRPPVGYFTDLATGFSVETGTPSLSTIDSIRAHVPDADLWPLSDTLAYHDWHFGGNGDTKTFMQTLETMFGEARSLEDFERKAQMMNLETHKAMYEGFLGHLWTKNSGRLLWMTHPAWPSHAWQIYSWDYDTHAAYYGAKKASEPLHVQLNLPGNELVVLNTTQQDQRGLTATTRVVSLDNRELFTRTDRVDALSNRATPLAAVPLDTIFAREPIVLVSLRLTDAQSKLISENFYWRGKTPGDYRALNALAKVTLAAAVEPGTSADGGRVARVTVRNTASAPALNAKLTLVDDAGQRILPAYYSDNYVSLLPGESRVITVEWPAVDPAGKPLPVRGSFRLNGWNVEQVGGIR